MKDRIGNELVKGKRVLVQLPEANVFGYVADTQEASVVSLRERTPGRVLVQCILALPVDDRFNQVAQCVVVEDPDKANFELAQAAINANGKPDTAN